VDRQDWTPLRGGNRDDVPTLLVTGHSGFVGRTLFERIAEVGDASRWQLVSLPDALDIRSPDLGECVRRLAPDAVVHLAAMSNVDESFRDPDACFDVNFRGTLNLLRALRAAHFQGRMIHVGSGDCYGTLPDACLPVDESTPLRPRSPYAVSKTAAEALCYQWSQTDALDVVIARPFNHLGPGQDARFAVASFCRQVARIQQRLAPPVLSVGNLDVTRDFTDVRDVLRAYFALLERGRTGEAYNVASGRETPLRAVIDLLLDIAGVEATIKSDPARQRPAEQRRVVANVAKVREHTGWSSGITLRETLTATLDYWKRRIRDE
jgi:GDP-4-dehydro-6-deoxy-D-mannose reductase